MSAALDALAGATYDGDVDSTDGSGNPTSVQPGSNYFMGALQSLTALGTGYIAARAAQDVQSRAYGAQPLPRLGTTQNPIGGYGGVVRTPQGQQVAQLNLSLLMPLVGVAVVAFLLARR